MTTDAGSIRAALSETQNTITRGLEDREALVVAGNDAGLSKTELAELSGLSRQSIYDILARAADRKKAANADAVAEVKSMWRFGQVIEDRWGLRWRADSRVNVPAEQVWFCRSVGLRVRLPHEKMATRGPLKKIRVDQVFAGEDAKIARRTGEAEDAAIVVEPNEDPEP